MTTMTKLSGACFGVVADAHIHPGNTPPFPDELETLFSATDAIIFLGDMGESSGLDWLEALAPVHGVRGGDDAADDARVQDDLKLFAAGPFTIGAVFEGTQYGLLAAADPLAPSPDFAQAAEGAFGSRIDVLLCGGSHVAFAGIAQGILIVNPGSPTLAEKRSVARIRTDRDVVEVEHHFFT